MATTLDEAYKTLKVLIIEDDGGTRRLIRRMLNQLGVDSITESEDGLKGLQEVLRTHPDLVLCDVHMSPVGGQEFLKMVREAKMDWVKEMPVIFLTSDNMLDSVRVAIQRHVDSYIVKPVSIEELKRHLDIVITRRLAK
jgi:two-component system chemotaxis response regulator CheY